jgi:hypothetical protein
MCPLDYALAVAILTAPPDATVQPDLVKGRVSIMSTLHDVAVAWEILDPREARDYEDRDQDFPEHVKMLRERHRDLRDAPPMHDCQRFPDRNLINDLLAFNRTYHQQLVNRQKLEVAQFWELGAAIGETDRLYEIWDLVRDSRTEFYYVPVRRAALKKLRTLVGSQAYYGGCLPPHVPMWNFARID